VQGSFPGIGGRGPGATAAQAAGRVADLRVDVRSAAEIKAQAYVKSRICRGGLQVCSWAYAAGCLQVRGWAYAAGCLRVRSWAYAAAARPPPPASGRRRYLGATIPRHSGI
jgi:hypothetical protein